MSTDLETLERLIDRLGLARTLETISEICHLKAEHLVSNWQDENAGAAWESAAIVIEATAGGPVVRSRRWAEVHPDPR